MSDWKFETRQIHSGAQPDPTTNARATPIYNTTAYVFNNAEHAKNLFALATQPVRRIFRFVIEPRPRWLFRDAP